MRRVLSVTATLLLAVTAARASPYWIEYEPANGQFPEEEGWERVTRYGGDQRSLEDGWLIMDGTASVGIQDYYVMPMNGGLDPEAGESFLLEWRILVEELVGYYDPSVAVFSDDQWAVGFKLSRTEILSSFEPGVVAAFEPGIPHSFALESVDMRSYVLSINGEPVIYRAFWESLYESDVRWGDGVYGGASLARWDYFRFGVVPECDGLVLGGSLMALSVLSRTGTRRIIGTATYFR